MVALGGHDKQQTYFTVNMMPTVPADATDAERAAYQRTAMFYGAFFCFTLIPSILILAVLPPLRSCRDTVTVAGCVATLILFVTLMVNADRLIVSADLSRPSSGAFIASSLESSSTRPYWATSWRSSHRAGAPR